MFYLLGPILIIYNYYFTSYIINVIYMNICIYDCTMKTIGKIYIKPSKLAILAVKVIRKERESSEKD